MSEHDPSVTEPHTGRGKAIQAERGTRKMARVYAQALLEAAVPQNAEREVFDELAGIFEMLDRHGDERIAVLLTSRAVPRRQKAELIREAFEGRVHPLLYNFLLVLNDRGRMEMLRVILQELQTTLDNVAGRVRVIVRSAVPLDDGHRERLRQQLQSVLAGREPVLKESVDPSLLGGLVVQVGDRVFDASVRARLDAIRTQLLARGTNVHAI
jgi:F-type H+-transporting ATPase subunit delta